MITDVTDTKIKMIIASTMIIDPYKLLLMLTESINVTLIEIQDITMTKDQIITK